jgi:hypothetical protein
MCNTGRAGRQGRQATRQAIGKQAYCGSAGMPACLPACMWHSPQAFSLSCSSMAFSPVAPEVDWMMSQVSWSAANLQDRRAGERAGQRQ